MKRFCVAAAVLGVLPFAHAFAAPADPVESIRQARQRHQAVAPVFGQPTDVTTLPVPTADLLGAEIRARLQARRPGQARPARSSGVQPGSTPTANPGPRSADDAADRQHRALSRLREGALGPVEIHLRPENQTLRQIRAAELLGEEVQSRARRASGGLPSKEALARAFLREHREVLRLTDPDSELVTTEVAEDLLGHSHVRFQQHHAGRPVALAGITVHFNLEGRLNLVDGAYVPTPTQVAEIPTVSAMDALTLARASVPGGFQGVPSEPRLVVHAPFEAPPRLAWEFELRVGMLQAWRFTVDATDGQILHRTSRVYDAAATGAGLDLFNTSRPLNLWSQGNTYYLADASKPMFNASGDPLTNPKGVITVLDARGTGINRLDDKTVFPISSANPNQWSVPAGVSAAFNFSQTYDYFRERHSRNSINGNGGNITAVVNVGDYDNASWHGDLSMMFFGNVRKYPGALDVVAHELAHGVTENSANLIYELQPGALNESFSDIFGECVEARTRGQNDWKLGADLGRVFRDLKNPGSIIIGGLNRPYPSKVSELVKLANSPDQDNGGVHINSSIINHTFYLLAAGLSGSLGLPDAERIFYRALTQHLKARSQFLDCRLGCIAAAEALFGPDSPQALKTAEAFDATEIFAGPTTPKPAPLPVVNAPDSLMFVYFDPTESIYNLGRREAALNDDPNLGNFRFSFDVRPTRPSLTGDGELVLFVDSLKTVCLSPTASEAQQECILSTRGLVNSIALSPDATLGAYVPVNPATGQPEGQIVVFGVLDKAAPTRTFNLVSPGLDGASVDQVLNADALVFSTDGHELIYDARSQLRFNGGGAVESWSLFSLNLTTERTAILVPPLEEFDTGNPALGRTGNRYLAFDATRRADGENAVLILDTFTGDVGSVVANGRVLGFPSFTGDEANLMYSQADTSASGSSLMLQKLADNRQSAVGQPGLFYADATLGTLYRRGAFVGRNAAPTITLAASVTNAPTPTPITLTATAQDTDGSVARVEYYDGPIKLGESAASPHRFVWNAPALGEHRVIARAFDNLGEAGDSGLIRIVIGAPVRLSAAVGISGPGSLRLTISAAPGNYAVQQSTDLRVWTDAFFVTVGASGTGIVDDTAGSTQPARFFRVRR